MKIADIIMDYAYSHERVLVRKNLITWMSNNYPDIPERSIDTAIRYLIKSNTLKRTGFGVMEVIEGKSIYIPHVSDDIQRIFNAVSGEYPYSRFCLWQANTLSSFMQHIPDIDIIILETDKVSSEAVYGDLESLELKRTLLLNPTSRECEIYAAGKECLIVRDLVTESPMFEVEGIPMASLEKILVDAQVLPELEFARGSELYTIYETASDMYRINKSSMLRYASRRGRKEETDILIKSTMI